MEYPNIEGWYEEGRKKKDGESLTEEDEVKVERDEYDARLDEYNPFIK